MNNETQDTTSPNAFSFISKSWREVRDSADADIQLMKNRANSFKNLASSFDRELENFIKSANISSTPAEIDFVKKLQPKISEFRRVYSAPEISKRVLEKWGPRARIRIDLSAIRNAIVAEVDEERDGGGIIDFDRGKIGRVGFREFWGERDGEGQVGEWEPIRTLKTRLREFERKRDLSVEEIFGGFKSSEFVEKVKSSWVCFLLYVFFLMFLNYMLFVYMICQYGF